MAAFRTRFGSLNRGCRLARSRSVNPIRERTRRRPHGRVTARASPSWCTAAGGSGCAGPCVLDKPVRSITPLKAETARARRAGPPKARARRGERRTRRRKAAPLDPVRLDSATQRGDKRRQARRRGGRRRGEGRKWTGLAAWRTDMRSAGDSQAVGASAMTGFESALRLPPTRFRSLRSCVQRKVNTVCGLGNPF